MELPKFKDSVIEWTETPSYLEVFHENNTILVRKKKPENSDTFENLYNKHAQNDAEDLNLTGTPLDCPFNTNEELDISLGIDPSTVKWRKNEELHFPFPIADAIRFLTEYNLNYKESDGIANKTVWVALDSKDCRGTVLMGFLIQGDWRIRKTVCQSMIPLNGVQAYGDNVRKMHMRMSGIKESNSKCKVSVTYDVARDSSESGSANIQLHSTWNTSLCRKDLTLPTAEASTTLNVELKIDSKQSEIHHLWNQLVFLNDLVAMTSRKDMALPESALTRVDTMERVVQLVNAADSYDMMCGGLAAKDVRAEDIKKLVQGERDTQDFPSKLWELLICCQSSCELVECFEYVLDVAERGEISPYIHPQNKSYFATLLLDLCTGVEMPKYFSLTKSSTLDMLKEMGFNALLRSYTHILLTSNWCSSYQLDTDFRNDNQMTKLGQMHIVLDTFLTTQNHMNLPLQCIQSLFSAAVVKFQEKFCSFEKILEQRSVTFSHAVRTTDVTCHLSKHFASWELQIETNPQDSDHIWSTICHVTNDTIFPPPLALPVLDLSAAAGEDFGDQLFTAQLTVIGNKITNKFVKF